MFGKLWTFHYFSETHDIPTFIWHFNTYETQSRDRRLDANIFGFQGKREVFFECFNFIKFYSFTRFETKLCDCRSHFITTHGHFYTKLKKCPLNNCRLKLDFFPRQRFSFGMILEYIAPRIRPISLIVLQF